MALDAKVNMMIMLFEIRLKGFLDESEVDQKELEAEKYDLSYVKLDGKIGCMIRWSRVSNGNLDIIKLKVLRQLIFLM